MKLIANYNEIQNMGKYLENETDMLNAKFDEIKEVIEASRSCWSGIDSENFITVSTNYIDNIKKMNLNEMYNLSKLIKHIGETYQGKDTEWEKNVKEVGFQDEYRQ